MDLYNLIVKIEASPFYLAMLIYFAWYPLTTSVMWIFTSLLFYRSRESGPQAALDAFYQTTETPSVSFLIPAYNEEANIAQTLRGVLAVDYSNFEVIVIDDFSTDKTRQEIAPFLANPRLRLIEKEFKIGRAHV